MLRLIMKNYMLHLPYSLLLVLQMVIVVFILNRSFVLVSNEELSLNNMEFTGGSLYFVTDRKYTQMEEDFSNKNLNIKKEGKIALEEIVEEDRIGFIYRNGAKSVDGKDSVNSPGVTYISPVIEKITCKLKSGTWFDGGENQVILGGEIAKNHKVGDVISISEEDVDLRATVVGILKEPAAELYLNTSDSDNMLNMLQKWDSVLLTNAINLVEGNGCQLEDITFVVDLSGTEKEQIIQQLEESYNVVSIKESIQYARLQLEKYTKEESMRLSIVLGIAFLSVAIQIFLYLKKNGNEMKLYQMLGMRKISMYGMLLIQHIFNIMIAFIVLYILQRNGVSFVADDMFYQEMLITVLFCFIYLLITGIVFAVNMPQEKYERDM